MKSEDAAPIASAYTAADLNQTMATGSAWMIAMRWIIRLLGLANTIVLVRLLVPEDFGLFAIAMLVVGFAEIVGTAGQKLAIIRHPNPTREHMDAAWTASLLVGAGLGLLVVLSAPGVAYLFDEPRAELLTYILSIRVFIVGFENIGVVMFRRELNFKKEFKYNIYQKLLVMAVTLSMALILKNYWALVAGSIIGHMLFLGVGYIVHPYRPRISFARIGEIWSFSGWYLLSLIGEFFQLRADRFIVGMFTNTTTLGFYHVGTELGRMPTFELIRPTFRALVPTYSKLTHDIRELKISYFDGLRYVALFVFSAGVGFACVAENFVYLVYGEKWASIIPVVVWTSLTASMLCLLTTTIAVMAAAGHSKTIAVLNGTNALMIVGGLMLVANETTDIKMIAAARFVLTALIVPFFFVAVIRIIPATIGEFIGCFWRPAIAAGLMWLAVAAIPFEAVTDFRLLALAMQIGVGMAVNFCVLWILWQLSGRPAGPEEFATRLIKAKVNAALSH